MNYLQQVNEIEKMIEKLPEKEKIIYQDKFKKIMVLSGGIHRMKLTALYSELTKKVPFIY